MGAVVPRWAWAAAPLAERSPQTCREQGTLFSRRTSWGVSTGILDKHHAVRRGNKGRWERRRTPTQDPSTDQVLASAEQ